MELKITKLRSSTAKNGGETTTASVSIDPSTNWAQHNVQFYVYPPQETIALIEMRNLAMMRYKVLTTVESIGLKHQKNSDDYLRELEFALRQIDFKVAITSMTAMMDSKGGKNVEREREYQQYRRNDYLSHFILRLAYCGSSDLRQWFIQQEVDLFRFRFSCESVSSVKNFLQLYGIPMELVPFDSKEYTHIEPIMKQLFPTRMAAAEDPDLKTDIFKVFFAEATDLVRNRKVYLRRGFAYVPYKELSSVVVGRFRSNLSRALAAISKHHAEIQDDLRLRSIVQSILGTNTSPSVTQSSDPTDAVVITSDMVSTIANESFPPCMRAAYKHLHTKHHHRHNGRMQFGLFLKSIGLSMEESLKFWRQEMAPVVDSEKFEKQYAYNIRHNYGKEGKRVDYTAYNCLKIINLPPSGASECHGCPFKSMDSKILQQNLENWGITNGDQRETIVELAQTRQYDRACSRFFEFQHGIGEGEINRLISHPNEFFEQSRKLRQERTISK